ncbi:hypothetical protein DLJ46_06060 [Micromonospora globispora]|uniref:Uncharacterized protein n=1 Tax=Micromonospora globispora TaxID=1450148 RepID=A0A317KGT6_9ACTN|nr:hypothetical protein DLJ46_06060 [Micromonospora globispora]
MRAIGVRLAGGVVGTRLRVGSVPDPVLAGVLAADRSGRSGAAFSVRCRGDVVVRSWRGPHAARLPVLTRDGSAVVTVPPWRVADGSRAGVSALCVSRRSGEGEIRGRWAVPLTVTAWGASAAYAASLVTALYAHQPAAIPPTRSPRRSVTRVS